MKSISSLLVLCATCLLLQGCAGGLIVVAATAVNVNGDNRTLSQQIDDDKLSIDVIDSIVALDINDQNMRINIIVNNRHVLLVGQVSTQANLNKIESTASQINGVKAVYNQLRVNNPIGITQQTKDSWITTKVKSQLASHDAIDPLQIKVVTENAEVFLIGQVTEETSNEATEVARHVAGVKQVVKVFELSQH